MKRKKFDFKAFFIEHGEKIGLGAFVLAFFALVWATLQIEPYQTTPDQVRQRATSLSSRVSEASEAQYISGRNTEQDEPAFEPADTRQLASAAERPLQGSALLPFAGGIQPPQRIRHQPRIFALEELHATAGRCTIAVVGAEEQRGGAAAAAEQEEQRIRVGGPMPPPRPRPRPAAERESGDLEGGGQPRGRRPQRGRGAEQMARGVEILEEAFGEGRGEGNGRRGEGGRRLDDLNTEGRTFVCLTGKIPLQRQQLEFYHQLAVTQEDYREEYNQVQYLSFEVQRVAVESFDQQIPEEAWKDSTLNLETVQDELATWAFVYPDLVPESLLSEVCSPLPPRVDRQEDQWLPREVVHPYFIDEKLTLDREGFLRQAREELERLQEEQDAEVQVRSTVQNPFSNFAGGRTERRRGEFSFGGYEGFEGGGYEEGPRRPGARPPAGRGPRPPRGRETSEGRQGRGEYDDIARRTPFRLFRFFDFTVEPGQTYVYRVRMVVKNPNHGLAETNVRLSSPDLATREFLHGSWSEPSPSRNIPDDRLLLFGGVRRGTSTRDDQPEVMIAEWVPRVGAMAYQLFGIEHRDLGLERPTMATPSGRRRPMPRHEYDVLSPSALIIRGSVLNFPNVNGLVVPPRASRPQNEVIDLTTDLMLVDMTGGGRLRAGSRASEYGHYCLIRPDGSIVETSQLQTLNDFVEARSEVISIRKQLDGDPGPGRGGDPLGGYEGFDPLGGLERE